jgi:NAD(P)-dependent dehydrogenase (short-subunit alcohol dehydrogenase family)
MATKAVKKVALVTGGGTGLGRDGANRLVRDGFTVAVVGRRAARLKPRRGERLHPYACDVADAGEVESTVRAVVRDLGRLDVLVNSAGIIRREPISKISPKAIDYTIGINLVGTMNVCLACLPALKKTHGTIINISSGLAHRPSPGSVVYAASKGGVEAFSKALAAELAPSGVRANVISPAAVHSEIYYADGMSTADYAALMHRVGKGYPLGRAGEERNPRRHVGPDATWITGAVIQVDGGKSVG